MSGGAASAPRPAASRRGFITGLAAGAAVIGVASAATAEPVDPAVQLWRRWFPLWREDFQLTREVNRRWQAMEADGFDGRVLLWKGGPASKAPARYAMFEDQIVAFEAPLVGMGRDRSLQIADKCAELQLRKAEQAAAWKVRGAALQARMEAVEKVLDAAYRELQQVAHRSTAGLVARLHAEFLMQPPQHIEDLPYGCVRHIFTDALPDLPPDLAAVVYPLLDEDAHLRDVVDMLVATGGAA